MLRPIESGDLLFEKEWRQSTAHFRVSIDSNHFAVTRFFGKGSMAGTRAFIAALNEGHAALPDVNDVRGMIDLRELEGVPVRGQFLLGKWLLKNKHNFYRISVFGGKTWEMNFARAVAKIARFKNIGFFADEETSITYLNG